MNLFFSEKKFCPQKAHISEENNYTIIIVCLFALILDNYSILFSYFGYYLPDESRSVLTLCSRMGSAKIVTREIV